MATVLPMTKDMFTLDIVALMSLVKKELSSLDKVADIIAEQLKLHPSYENGDAELSNIVNNLQNLPAGDDEKHADFYATIEWLKDWGDLGDRLLVIDDENDPYALERL